MTSSRTLPDGRPSERSAERTDDLRGDLPGNLQALLRTALDDDAPRVARLRAVQSLENAPAPFRRAVAAALVPLLHDAPDVAGRVHLALLVLAPDLRLLREDQDGRDRFVVVDRGFSLDELPKLFAPGEDLPAFLTPPDKPLPGALRAPDVVRVEQLALLVAARQAEREALLMRMQDLGLDPDDLDDDDGDDVDERPRRRFVPLRGGDPWASFSFVDDRDVVVRTSSAGVAGVVALGRLRPGAWWSESTAGDHRGARRFRVGVAVDMAPAFTTRRERTLEVGSGGVSLQAGDVTVVVPVGGRAVVVWVDEDAGDVVGITLSWSSVGAFRNPGEPEPKAKPRLRL